MAVKIPLEYEINIKIFFYLSLLQLLKYVKKNMIHVSQFGIPILSMFVKWWRVAWHQFFYTLSLSTLMFDILRRCVIKVVVTPPQSWVMRQRVLKSTDLLETLYHGTPEPARRHCRKQFCTITSKIGGVSSISSTRKLYVSLVNPEKHIRLMILFPHDITIRDIVDWNLPPFFLWVSWFWTWEDDATPAVNNIIENLSCIR